MPKATMDGFNSNQNYEFQQGYYNSGYGGDQNFDQGSMYQQQGFNRDNIGIDPGSHYPQQQQPYGYSEGGWEQQPVGQQWNSASEKTQDGTFYFNADFTPQISGYPVNSLAFDSAYEAIYVASATQSVSSTRWRGHNASMLVTHSTSDGMLFSSVAGHPEATSSTLQSVYNCLFGIRKVVPAAPGRQKNIPPHAYKASFGGHDVDPSAAVPGGGKRGHIGISSILPLGGYAATVSPSAVRIHSHGGLQLHDLDIEGMMCGTIHPHSDSGDATHISVGGLSVGPNLAGNQVHCVDLWQGLRIVSSRTFKDTFNKDIGATVMASSHERGTIIAGCSDGNIRMLDGSLREVATVKSHAGGVSSMAVSPDGMLVATTGYSSRAKGIDAASLYAFPDPTCYVYDIRYLGRGGISHPFAGVGGMPHHVTFLPDMSEFAPNRLLVASGKSGGGVQVLVPFEAQNENSISFFQPQLEQGEFMSAITQSDENLGIGTNRGRVLTYKLAGYKPSAIKSKATQQPEAYSTSSFNASDKFRALSGIKSNAKNKKKKPLKMPPFLPTSAPGVPFPPSLLVNPSDPSRRNGADDRIKSLFSTYVLQSNPKLTFIGNSVQESMSTFGPLGASPIVLDSQRKVAGSFLSQTTPGEMEYLLTIPTSKLDVDILSNHNKISKRYQGKKDNDVKQNPNKFLYCDKLSSLCYEDGIYGRRKQRVHQRSSSSVSAICSMLSLFQILNLMSPIRLEIPAKKFQHGTD